ncbi:MULTISPECIES: ferredoxin reductase family protein [Alphaproteobacteria]|uniref:FAD-binding FR-type domain-containing protein n=2 Tax=Alphaproteobacteria TaxID=28211 RepID=A0A512HCL5_9HYPH|nr:MULTISPECIES: ferric reductase-like transmembrane domain-containing protein [Alphaproteobacteria]GEO83201.1 hypothetical protein RNA01_01330 [Ciceribacter naphthalenivorans]GLR20404.1 hypothetical protein GCM10007920_01880 [Ciceribacter naphthalenivorans]GLT03260.1 hypothetical protein GCM10007926_01880 [Sphingomonas psychrolutea]
MMEKVPRPRPWALSSGSLAILYITLTAAPVLLASLSGGAHAPTVFPLLARAAGVAALSMFLMQFGTSGRFETISGRIGLDRSMGFHRIAASAALVMLTFHVALFLFRGRTFSLSDIWNRLLLYLTMPSLLTGVIAAALAVILVLSGKYMRGRGLPYPLWRLSHGITAVALAGLGLHHAFTNARFMADGYGSAAVIALAALAFGSLAFIYLLRPRQVFRPGFKVASARALSPTVSELVLETDKPDAFDFNAGQFAWLTIGHRHTVTDNPFSIASAPSDLPRLRFLIRKAGDMTRAIEQLKPGTPVGVDGPHGSFTLTDAGSGPLLLIAGGIGIAPILSLLRELAATNDTRPIRLLAGARSPEDHIVRAEIATLMVGRDFRSITLADQNADGMDCESGGCDASHITRLLEGLNPGETTAFVCGPPAMMQTAVALITAAGVPLDRIVMERFDFDAGNDALCRSIRYRFIAVLAAVFAAVTVATLAASA